MLHIVLYHEDNCAISIDINLSKNNHIGKLWNYWQNMDIWIVFGQSMAFRPLWWSNIGCPLLLSILFGNITTKFHLDYTILVPDNGHTQQFAKLLAKHGYSCRFFGKIWPFEPLWWSNIAPWYQNACTCQLDSDWHVRHPVCIMWRDAACMFTLIPADMNNTDFAVNKQANFEPWLLRKM